MNNATPLDLSHPIHQLDCSDVCAVIASRRLLYVEDFINAHSGRDHSSCSDADC
jgi:hypothetical protein